MSKSMIKTATTGQLSTGRLRAVLALGLVTILVSTGLFARVRAQDIQPEAAGDFLELWRSGTGLPIGLVLPALRTGQGTKGGGLAALTVPEASVSFQRLASPKCLGIGNGAARDGRPYRGSWITGLDRDPARTSESEACYFFTLQPSVFSAATVKSEGGSNSECWGSP